MRLSGSEVLLPLTRLKSAFDPLRKSTNTGTIDPVGTQTTITGKMLHSLLLCAMGFALVAAAPRQPSGRWVVEFDDAQCLASRNYGTRDDPLVLVLKSPPSGDVIQIGVMRAAKRSGAVQLDAEVAIDERTPVRTPAFVYTAKQQKQRAYLINLPAGDFAPAKVASALSIRAKGELDERFAISAIGPLLKLMDECVADLRKVWNVSDAGAANAQLRQRAGGTVQDLLQHTDYPLVAVNQSQSGSATFVLLIDESGRVADCTVTGTSGAATLDAQTCGVVRQRARFKPAIGQDGKPAKDHVVERVTWLVE